MKLKHSFSASAVDYFGYVSSKAMMQEINEGVAMANYADGVGFSHLFPTLGITWMLGQCVLEFMDFVPCAEEVEIETGGHEQFGVSTVRRSLMRFEGREVMRFSAKLLPVYFHERKVVPPSVLEPFWKSPAAPQGEPICFLKTPAEMTFAEEYLVRFRDCDSNRHMTAFRYLELILETVGYWDGEPRLAKRIQIDYKKECLPGERLRLMYAERDGIRYCAGIKADGSESFLAAVTLSEESYPRAKVTRV